MQSSQAHATETRKPRNFLREEWMRNVVAIRSVWLASTWAVAAMILMLGARNDLLAVGLPIVVACGMWALPSLRPCRPLVLWVQLGGYSLLLVFEILIRVKYFGVDALINPLRYSPSTSISKLVRPATSDELVYELVPDYQGVYMGKGVRTNGIGCRGPNTGKSPAEGTRRIMVFGSSIAFGAGVDESQSYSAIAATTLRHQGYAVEILNCGLPAAVPALSFARARAIAKAYNASDVVIELAPSNLLDTGSIEFSQHAYGRGAQTELPISQLERYSFALAGIYPAAYLRQRIDNAVHRRRTTVSQPAPSTHFVQSELRKLVEVGRREGYRVFVFLVRGPSLAEPEPALVHARNQLQSLAQTLGVTVADTWALFTRGEFQDDFIVFPGDLHPNARAHDKFGVSLAAGLVGR